jgi:hypothetical protein
MQLVAYGAQDVYLTGNPQITFFKVVYRRHTNFACESIQQTFNGSVDFGRKVTATISRNGDLITNCWVEADLPALTSGGWVNSVGHALLKEVELEIGGQRIDKHYADWLEIWSELSVPAEKRDGYKMMVGKYDVNPTLSAANNGATVAAKKLYIPLQFFFNRNPGLALPLIALQYHEVKINIQFGSLDECSFGPVSNTGAASTSGSLNASLYVDYVYLDTDERRRFAQVSHEMLIEQLQFTGDESVSSSLTGSSNKIRLNFNHPVKELIWVVKNTDDVNDANPFSYGANDDEFFEGSTNNNIAGEGLDTVKDAKLLLNGHDRFAQRDGSYFRLVQPYQHHTCVPKKNIYVYSFALKPEEHQPSGTCNFSRIDNATLSLTVLSGTVAKVFATSYNVLRIMSGMGGLAYSN